MRSQLKKEIQESKQQTPKGRRWKASKKRKAHSARKNGKAAYDPKARPIEDIIAEIAAEIPREEWDKLPKDLNKNLDHYLYGAPKK